MMRHFFDRTGSSRTICAAVFENDGGLLPITSSAVDLCSPFAVPTQKIEGEGGAFFALAVLASP
jgi:hypothetical protein